MFRKHTCPICFDSSFSHGHGELCWDCVNAFERDALPGIIWHMFRTLRLPAEVTDLMEACLLQKHDASAIFRTTYLRKMLLGPMCNPTPFRLLTYCGNRMAGNISMTEDIIDRVLAFAVTLKRVGTFSAASCAMAGADGIPPAVAGGEADPIPTCVLPQYLDGITPFVQRPDTDLHEGVKQSWIWSLVIGDPPETSQDLCNRADLAFATAVDEDQEAAIAQQDQEAHRSRLAPQKRASAASSSSGAGLASMPTRPPPSHTQVVTSSGCDSGGDDLSSGCGSIIVDDSETEDSAVAVDLSWAHRAPKNPAHGVRQHRPSPNNECWDVGNFGLYVGNWGLRGSLKSKESAKKRAAIHDRQIMGNPGQVLVLAEASATVEELLKLPNAPGDGVAGRPTCEHFVVRTNEESGLLIACRKDNTERLTQLSWNIHTDFTYQEKGKQKAAVSRILVCDVGFKQNVGYLGRSVVICAVHGHFRTMKMEKPTKLAAFWNRLADHVREFRVKFVAGDFNMALTEVCNQLGARGITCDCVAWYPWKHVPHETTLGTQGPVADLVSNIDGIENNNGQRLGFDSCGIFYIGGEVEVRMPWSLDHFTLLTAVAGTDCEADLDEYSGQNRPGQPWHCYRSRTKDDKPGRSHLGDRLEDLLTPSSSCTTAYLETLAQHARTNPGYLRLKQKAMRLSEWRVDGEMHNGAHMPICVFTDNQRARSEDGQSGRADKRRLKSREGNRKDAAVAATKGSAVKKGCGKKGDAVAYANAPWRNGGTGHLHQQYSRSSWQNWQHWPPDQHDTWQQWQQWPAEQHHPYSWKH